MNQLDRTQHQQINKLIELNDELENYFRNTIIPQLFVDANLILRKFTPPAMRQFSLSADHIGLPLAEVVDHIRFSTIIEDIQQVIDTGEILEKEVQTVDSLWFQMNIIPYLIKKENRANGVIITFVDITDRIKDLKRLERLNASHETFIYAVSHDLNAPLANIESLIHILIEESGISSQKGDAGNKEQEMIGGMLDQSVVLMRNILNELAEIAKIEGDYPEMVETLNFEQIIREVEIILHEEIKESKAQIIYDIKELKVVFSRKNLRSIIYNLLSNAIKYRSPERSPKIFVQTAKVNGILQLSVQDNGLGISEVNKEKVFDRFSRFRENVKGVGIGLYLVGKIMQNSGGSIQVDSTLGVGSEFKILFNPAGN